MKNPTIFSESANQLLRFYLPMRDDFNNLMTNKPVEIYNINSKNGEMNIILKGNYEIKAVSYSESLFSSRNKEIEKQTLETINLALEEVTKNTADGIKRVTTDGKIISMFASISTELRDAITDFQTDYMNLLKNMEQNKYEYIAKNKVKIEISGGLRILSLEIDQKYLGSTSKGKLESEIKRIINKAIGEIQLMAMDILQKCQNKYFNTNIPASK